MKKQDQPLTVEEVAVARDLFFDVYNVVKEKMAEDASLRRHHEGDERSV